MQVSAMRALAQIQTREAEIEFFCRTCRGHYSSTVAVDALSRKTCRCGSSDLLVYQLTAGANAPLINYRSR
jgi:hypothetical protein